MYLDFLAIFFFVLIRLGYCLVGFICSDGNINKTTTKKMWRETMESVLSDFLAN